MIAWCILAGGISAALLLEIWLRHRVDMARRETLPAEEQYERGRRDGMEAAARIIEVDTHHKGGPAFAATIRAAVPR